MTVLKPHSRTLTGKDFRQDLTGSRHPPLRERRGFLPANSPSFDGDGSADLNGQATDSEVFAPEQALRACPALRIFLAALASAFSA